MTKHISYGVLFFTQKLDFNLWLHYYKMSTEAVQPNIHFVFNELNQKKLVAETQTANTRSCMFFEKLGMQLER